MLQEVVQGRPGHSADAGAYASADTARSGKDVRTSDLGRLHLELDPTQLVLGLEPSTLVVVIESVLLKSVEVRVFRVGGRRYIEK